MKINLHAIALIDLLKPEMEGAVGVLLALDPKQFKKITKLLPILGEKVVDSFEIDKRLASDGTMKPDSGESSPRSVEDLLGSNLMQLRELKTEDQMLMAAEEAFRNNSHSEETDDETLGTIGYIKDRLVSFLTGSSKAEALRRALLDWLKDDPSFDISAKDTTYKKIIEQVGPSVDFIVTGHTHLERAIEINNNRFYFNCGTWIRLLRITREMLLREDTFKPVYDVLEKGGMTEIDSYNFHGKPFVMDRSTAVSIGKTKDKVTGRLLHVKTTEAGLIETNTIAEFSR